MGETRPKNYAKLDMYDYHFKKENGHITQVRIPVDSNTDVDIADIASEINACDGNIFVEGHYLWFHEITTAEIFGRTNILIIATEV